MARVRSPDRDKAFEIYKSHGGNIDLVEIAKQLNISDGTVRGWKNKDKWEQKLNGTFQKENKKNTERSKRNKGGQPNNKNATGNPGGLGGPVGNKKAVTTGEFESIFFDTLEDDEKELIEKIEIDKRRLLEQEIQLLTVRERRMLKRIDELKHQQYTVVSIKQGIEKGQDTNLQELEGTLGQIQSIEEALTRIQDKKAKCISELHRWEMDHAKLELDVIKLELEVMKRGNQDEEIEDDGFIDALKSEVGDTWDDD